MRDLVRSTVSTGIALTAAGALAITPAALPAEPFSLQTAVAGVRLSASSTLMPATPPPRALVQQFLTNQAADCSLICPFIVQFATQPLINFAAIPATFVRELQSGEPLLQAIALTDATVSGAANDALTGIVTNDLEAALPRAQHSLEVAVIGLIGIGTTAVTAPGNLLDAVTTARTDLFSALRQPPGPTPPAVHSALEAGAVRVIEVASALTFQAPERLLLGVTQAANALFTSLGATGNVGTALAAVGASVTTAVSESVDLIRHALNEPIPISPAAATTTTTKVHWAGATRRQGGARQGPKTGDEVTLGGDAGSLYGVHVIPSLVSNAATSVDSPTSLGGHHAESINHVLLGAGNRRDDRIVGRRVRFVQQEFAKRNLVRTEHHVRGGVVLVTVEGQW